MSSPYEHPAVARALDSGDDRTIGAAIATIARPAASRCSRCRKLEKLLAAEREYHAASVAHTALLHRADWERLPAEERHDAHARLMKAMLARAEAAAAAKDGAP